MTFIAVDWSGAVSGERRTIWLAEDHENELVRLECGRNRAEVVQYLIGRARSDASIVVGLDFAFSLPEWFLIERGLASGPDLWALAGRDAEQWLAGCRPPFWGRPGFRRPALPNHFRWTDTAVPAVNGIRPKSGFQIGGAGAVGTGSLRGMPFLTQLRHAGFAIWPFDPPRRPLVIEIYPRLLTQTVNKSSAEGRHGYLLDRLPDLHAELRARLSESDDAFDAGISALTMARHHADLATLPAILQPRIRREGLIWHPRWREAIETL